MEVAVVVKAVFTGCVASVTVVEELHETEEMDEVVDIVRR